MKRNLLFSILIFLMVLQLNVLPAAAGGTDTTQPTTAVTQSTTAATQSTTATQTTTATQSTTATTQPTTATTQPTTATTQPTTATTQPTTSATQPSTESTTAPTTSTECAHVWYPEIITVAPTCKDAGGKAKFCTVCEYILITEITPPLTTHTYTNACDTECNVCGVKREITHTYSAVWARNGKGHWHPCAICGAAGELKAHYPGPAATEEKEQICLTCGYVLMSKRGHEHEYSQTWSTDEFGHWYACSGCSELREYAAHVYDSGCDGNCDICGYTRTAPHVYGADWQQTETTHSGVCTVCGEQTSEEPHSPDPAGTNCTVCGYVLQLAETEAEESHVHTFDESVWGFDDAGHWRSCSCGEKQMAQPHNWDEGRELTKKTVTYTCQTCGAQRQEQVQQGSFPWLLLVIIVIMVAAAAGIVVCVVLLKKQGKYSR